VLKNGSKPTQAHVVPQNKSKDWPWTIRYQCNTSERLGTTTIPAAPNQKQNLTSQSNIKQDQKETCTGQNSKAEDRAGQRMAQGTP